VLPCDETDPDLSLLCPVHAVQIYLDSMESFRHCDQLFVWFGGQQKGKAVPKQKIAHWIVDAISLAYQIQGVSGSMGV